MNRDVTNAIRFFLDSFLPPILRDNKYFMYPAFYIWFNGKNVSKLMEFKQNIETMTEEEYTEYYRIVSIQKRTTDLNKESIAFIYDNIGNKKGDKIIDIGCGNGFLLSQLKKKGYTDLTGCDIVNIIEDKEIPFVEANIEHLPFEDNAFDTVICNHTIEHVINSDKAVKELKRIAKNKIILNTPRQKYFRYTLDLHVNFYPNRKDLLSLLNMQNYRLIENSGDWSFVGEKKGDPSITE